MRLRGMTRHRFNWVEAVVKRDGKRKIGGNIRCLTPLVMAPLPSDILSLDATMGKSDQASVPSMCVGGCQGGGRVCLIVQVSFSFYP